MDNNLRPTDLASAAGISQSYASMILAGDRKPGRALAVRIYRVTGHKLGPVVSLSDTDIDALERIEAALRPASEGIAA